MAKTTARVIATVAVLTGALTLLFFVTVSSTDTQYYKHVDEVMTQPAQWYGKGLQLHGFVVDGTIEKRPDSLDYRFRIKNGDAAVLATYTGTLPDTFKDGSEVVLKGKLGPGGFQVEPVPWDREAAFRMPVTAWREMVEQHFPGCGWIRLPRDTMDALLAYRSRHALPSWEATLAALLDGADPPAHDPLRALTATTGRTDP
jgi:cytochrome c-type biogenesis protein CcmE